MYNQVRSDARCHQIWIPSQLFSGIVASTPATRRCVVEWTHKAVYSLLSISEAMVLKEGYLERTNPSDRPCRWSAQMSRHDSHCFSRRGGHAYHDSVIRRCSWSIVSKPPLCLIIFRSAFWCCFHSPPAKLPNKACARKLSVILKEYTYVMACEGNDRANGFVTRMISRVTQQLSCKAKGLLMVY